MSDTSYAAKIAALLAKAEATDNDHEAEAYSAKAEILMLKWGVDEAMLAAATGNTNTERIVKAEFLQTGVYHTAWMLLANSIAIGLGSLKLVKSTYGTNRTLVYIIGHESDVARFRMLFDSLKAQAEGASKHWWKANRTDFTDWYGEIDNGAGFRARRSFLISFGAAVSDRLRAERADVIAETEHTSTGTSADLVLVNRAKRVEDAVSDFFPRLGNGRASRMQGSAAGSRAGRAAGQRANLGGARQVSR